MSDESLGVLLEDSATIICAGSGGVGKTTLAAALGVAAARMGRRVAVVTIDPARRLADALGLGADGLGDEPSRLVGPWSGQLWASMLEVSTMFDSLVRANASAGQAERILANRFYRNIAGALSGTQEYMAAEKLYELHCDERFDLVIVDTPPTRNALDFLNAPGTLVRFLDHPLYRALVAPTRTMTRALSAAGTALLRSISAVVGTALVEDVVEFFRAFEGLEEGFRERARAVDDLFVDEHTAFVVITSPRSDALAEALWFARNLKVAVRAVVVNRIQPRFCDGPLDRFRSLTTGHPGSDLAALCDALIDHDSAADIELAALEALRGEVAPAPVILVGARAGDISDLDGLVSIASTLGGDTPAG